MSSSSIDTEQFRPYVRLLARQQFPEALRAKLDASDVVQETMIRIYQHRDRLHALESGERLAYVRRVLTNRLRDVWRRFDTQKRDARMERTAPPSVDSSAIRIESWIKAQCPSPSDQLHQEERTLQLAAELAKLPDDQQLAVELHHLEGLSLTETAERMNRTEASVAGLLRRAMNRLRTVLGTYSGGAS